MSIPQRLTQWFDRPVAYHRILRDITGSTTSALMLSHALYWQQHTISPDNWWCKSQRDWYVEVGLTRSEYETARRILRKHGLLEEQRRGIPARKYYRINTKKLRELLEAKNELASD